MSDNCFASSKKNIGTYSKSKTPCFYPQKAKASTVRGQNRGRPKTPWDPSAPARYKPCASTGRGVKLHGQLLKNNSLGLSRSPSCKKAVFFLPREVPITRRTLKRVSNFCCETAQKTALFCTQKQPREPVLRLSEPFFLCTFYPIFFNAQNRDFRFQFDPAFSSDPALLRQRAEGHRSDRSGEPGMP